MILIEKIDGCDQMKCKDCHFEFNWAVTPKLSKKIITKTCG